MTTTAPDLSAREDLVRGFAAYFSEQGLTAARPAPLLPDDDTLLFTNATIVPLKRLIERGEIPAGGVHLAQPCLRTQNLKLDRGQEPEYLSYFTMLGIFLPPPVSHEDLVRLTHGYLTGPERIPADRIALHTNPATGFLRDAWHRAAPGSQLFEGHQPSDYYEWTYGEAGWSGEGVTFALRQLDGSWLDIGNIIEMRSDGELLGYEFGFGVETYLARKHGVGDPYLLTGLHALLVASGDTVDRAVQDGIMTVACMFAAGARPGRRGSAALVRTAVHGLLQRLDEAGVDLRTAGPWLRAFTERELPGGAAAAQDAVAALESYARARDVRVERFRDYAVNQSRLWSAGALRGKDPRPELVTFAAQRYGLEGPPVGDIIQQAFKDVEERP
ncbi:alanine--tRNA ligase-related protein [Streptomyces venezuelae]|uniref:alanine--tRNA ligase-related protein n=1 Tax=Streptomyces venezuelae TaxID=54571 RepID=UPI003660787C